MWTKRNKNMMEIKTSNYRHDSAGWAGLNISGIDNRNGKYLKRKMGVNGSSVDGNASFKSEVSREQPDRF